MGKKRIRVQVAKPGELKVAWGRSEPHARAEVCYAWGPGIDRADGRLLHSFFNGERVRISFPKMDHLVIDPSFLDELAERGYDLTTIKFSIQKKVHRDEFYERT